QNLDRLTRKFATAVKLMPKPVIRKTSRSSKLGIVNFGSTEPAVREACDLLARTGYKLNTMRLRAFPFGKEVAKFAANHDRIFLVEQNRDAQMRSLLITEAGIPAHKLISVLNYDGMPLTADWVKNKIEAMIETDKSVAAAMQLSVRAM
ncbi:MAG: hypothetical protein ACE5FM_10165, partial [Methyloligellaceae bacterium]